MGNVVPANSTAVGAYTAGANPWAEAAKGIETGAYLKFNGNDGRYSFGQDDEDLPAGSRVVGDMETLAFGFICWVDSAVEEEVLVPVIDGRPPLEHELTDHGPYDEDDGWREAASISLVLESYGEDDQDEAVGTPLLWKTSTGGQVRQIRKLAGAYGRVFAQHPGEFPIIELGAESYVPKNKKHGKIKWSPALKIVGWITAAELEGLTGAAAGDDDDYEEPAPAPKRAAKEEAPARGRRAAPAPEPEDEDEAPAPRRSRRDAPAEEVEEEAEAPAPRRSRRAPEPEDDDGEPEAPAPRRGRREAAPADDEGEAPAPRRGRREAAPADDEDDGDEAAAPAPRGRSAGRGAPAGGRRVRNFD